MTAVLVLVNKQGGATFKVYWGVAGSRDLAPSSGVWEEQEVLGPY